MAIKTVQKKTERQYEEDVEKMVDEGINKMETKSSTKETKVSKERGMKREEGEAETKSFVVSSLILHDFIKKSSVEIDDLALQFNDDGLVCSSMNPDQTVYVGSQLSKASLIRFMGTDYEVGIRNVSTFLGLLKSLGEECNSVVQNNFLIIKSGNKTVDYALLEEVDTKFRLGEKLQTPNKFRISQKDLSHAIGIIEGIKAESIMFECKNKTLIISASSENDAFRESFRVECGDFKHRYNLDKVKRIVGLFDDSVSFELQFSAENNQPMRILVDEQNQKFEYLIAPLME